MHKTFKILTLTLLGFFLFTNSVFAVDPASYTRTILPETNKDIIKSNADCRLIITNFEYIYFNDLNFTELNTSPPTDNTIDTPTENQDTNSTNQNAIQPNGTQTTELGSIKRFTKSIELLNNILKENQEVAGIKLDNQELTQNDILGCAIVTGRISFMYLSIFFSYALNMIAILSGSISMIFIIIGGYKYVIGSLTQNTDDAKKTITNAIIGLLLSTSAWIIVNIVLAIVSS